MKKFGKVTLIVVLSLLLNIVIDIVLGIIMLIVGVPIMVGLLIIFALDLLITVSLAIKAAHGGISAETKGNVTTIHL